jgi:hypothetical protein
MHGIHTIPHCIAAPDKDGGCARRTATGGEGGSCQGRTGVCRDGWVEAEGCQALRKGVKKGVDSGEEEGGGGEGEQKWVMVPSLRTKDRYVIFLISLIEGTGASGPIPMVLLISALSVERTFW